MTAATATKKAASTSLSWEEWLHERDQAQSERDKAAGRRNAAQGEVSQSGMGAWVGFQRITEELAWKYGNGFHIDRPNHEGDQQEYVDKLKRILTAPGARVTREEAADLRSAHESLGACINRREDARNALAEAEEELEAAKDRLRQIESNRPAVSKTTISALDKQVADAESDAERINASIARTEEEARALGVALEEIDLPSLAVDVELATDDDRKPAQAALASAQKRYDSLQAELARTEALLEGLQRRAAAADERVAEMRSLRRQVAFEFLHPQLMDAEAKLVEVINGPLNDAMLALLRLQSEVNEVAPEDQDFSSGLLEVKLPWLSDENMPEGGNELTLPRRTEPRAIG
ncbi:MAG: hypothetical protein CME38_08740 [Haliea sp.]|nr:hypothetical protein [Haliea sp.]